MDSSTSVGRKPASVLPAPVGAISNAEAIVAGLCEQRELMLARRPSARGEPLAETVRQQLGRFGRRSGNDAGRHA